MKVLQIGKFYPPHWGGMETALKDICETTAPHLELDVVVAGEERIGRKEDGPGFRIERLARWGTVCSQPICPGLLAYLRRSRAAIVHLHEPNPLAMATFLVSGHPAQLVVHYHSDIVRQKRLACLYRPILERGLRRAVAILAGSQELIDNSPVLGRFASKCIVVPFGIDLRPFLALAREEKPAEQPGGDLPLVLAVGRLSYYKGFHYLIEAVRHLPVRLVIAGDGEMKPELERQANRLGLSGRVTLRGSVSTAQLLSLYRAADLFCLPSCERSEAFGLVQLEAMGAGLPIVSTDLPTGMRSINVDGQTGFRVAPHDAAALASAIAKLAADPGLRARMGTAARRRAQTHYCREAMGRRILEIYASVISESRPHFPFHLTVGRPAREVML